jgi:hypothetical protein
MGRSEKVRLYVSLRNVYARETDALLEHIESAVTRMERALTLVDCRVTVEGADSGTCRAQVDVTLPQARRASSAVVEADARRAIDGACARLVTKA